MSTEKQMVKQPQVASLSNKRINLLLDLGNCFKLTCGHNTLSRNNLAEFCKACCKNVSKFDKESARIYKRDLALLNLTINSFPDEKENIMFGELCRAFYKLKNNELNSPRKEEKYLSSITKKLGESSEEDIKDGD